MSATEALRGIISTPKYAATAIAIFIVLAPVFALTSGLIVPPSFELNAIAELPKIGMVAAIVGLLAVNVAVLRRNMDMNADSGKAVGIFGGVAGMFTSTCAVCQPVWLIWIGFGSASAFLAEISYYIGAVSIVLLAFGLNGQLKAAEGCDTGGVKKWKRQLR